jgi:hypothetical protein
MDYTQEIEELLESRADALIKKHSHREEFAQTVAQLTVLMAKYIDKSSASFDNKIQLLLKVPEIEEEVIKLNESYHMDEVLYKKHRDLDEFFKYKIIEIQSRRKSEIGVL